MADAPTARREARILRAAVFSDQRALCGRCAERFRGSRRKHARDHDVVRRLGDAEGGSLVWVAVESASSAIDLNQWVCVLLLDQMSALLQAGFIMLQTLLWPLPVENRVSDCQPSRGHFQMAAIGGTDS